VAWQVSALERDRTVALSSTGAVVVNTANAAIDIVSVRCRGDAFRRMLRFNPVVCSSVVMRRDAWILSGCRFAGSACSMEDYALWLKLAARYRFYISPKLFVRYYVGPSSKTCSRSVEMHRERLREVFQDASRDEVFRQRLATEHVRPDTSIRLSAAREFCARGRSSEARSELMAILAQDWRALTYRSFWNTLLWSGRTRAALRGLRRRVAVRVRGC
jgi:hypothetical protein